jgi:hypothetical protein
MTRVESSASEMVVIEKDGRFFLFQPDLGVIVSDESLEKAHAKFVDVRQAFLKDVERAGVTLGRHRAASTSIPTSAVSVPSRQVIAVELGLFAVKFCVILVFVVATGAVVVGHIAKAVDQAVLGIAPRIDALTKLSLADVSIKAADIARDAQNLPESRKEALRQSIAVISRELEPVAEAWRNPGSVAPAEIKPGENKPGR